MSASPSSPGTSSPVSASASPASASAFASSSAPVMWLDEPASLSNAGAGAGAGAAVKDLNDLYRRRRSAVPATRPGNLRKTSNPSKHDIHDENQENNKPMAQSSQSSQSQTVGFLKPTVLLTNDASQTSAYHNSNDGLDTSRSRTRSLASSAASESETAISAIGTNAKSSGSSTPKESFSAHHSAYPNSKNATETQRSTSTISASSLHSVTSDTATNHHHQSDYIKIEGDQKSTSLTSAAPFAYQVNASDLIATRSKRSGSSTSLGGTLGSKSGAAEEKPVEGLPQHHHHDHSIIPHVASKLRTHENERGTESTHRSKSPVRSNSATPLIIMPKPDIRKSISFSPSMGASIRSHNKTQSPLSSNPSLSSSSSSQVLSAADAHDSLLGKEIMGSSSSASSSSLSSPAVDSTENSVRRRARSFEHNSLPSQTAGSKGTVENNNGVTSTSTAAATNISIASAVPKVPAKPAFLQKMIEKKDEHKAHHQKHQDLIRTWLRENNAIIPFAPSLSALMWQKKCLSDTLTEDEVLDVIGLLGYDLPRSVAGSNAKTHQLLRQRLRRALAAAAASPNASTLPSSVSFGKNLPPLTLQDVLTASALVYRKDGRGRIIFGFFVYDITGAGRLPKSDCLSGALAAALFLYGDASRGMETSLSKAVDACYERFDGDGDGWLTREEFITAAESVPFLNELFCIIPADDEEDEEEEDEEEEEDDDEQNDDDYS